MKRGAGLRGHRRPSPTLAIELGAGRARLAIRAVREEDDGTLSLSLFFEKKKTRGLGAGVDSWASDAVLG
jgi:hypothetical protein